MSDNVFCPGQRRINGKYRDGWYRSFVGMPQFSKAAKGLLVRYIEEGDFAAAMVVLTDKFGLDEDYSLFVIRELGAR